MSDPKCKSRQFVVRDSGQREDFDTGARRDVQTGKPRFDLIPIGILRRLADHYGAGADKYGDNNWRKGLPMQRTLASLQRHLADWIEGRADEEDHGIAVIWNMIALLWTEEEIAEGGLPAELDDLVDRLRDRSE